MRLVEDWFNCMKELTDSNGTETPTSAPEMGTAQLPCSEKENTASLFHCDMVTFSKMFSSHRSVLNLIAQHGKKQMLHLKKTYCNVKHHYQKTQWQALALQSLT